MKQLSIIIPCYNAENYIQRCIDSLTAQTMNHAEIELIFVNDASADETISILLTNEKKQEEWMLVINCEEHIGVSAARNLGMQYAAGKYIGFVDSDDFVSSDMYERLINGIESSGADFAVSDFFKVSNEKEAESHEPIIREEAFVDLSCLAERKSLLGDGGWNTSVCNKIYRKAFLEANHISFPTGVRYEDAYFSYLVFALAESAYDSGRAMYYYFYNEKSIMRGGDAVSQLERVESCELLLLELKKRELIKPYFREWEMVFIKKYYTEVLHLMMMVFDEIPYEIYTHICAWMKREFPDCHNNPYLRKQCNSVEQLYMEMMDLTPQQLKQMQEKIRNIKETI